MQKIKFKNIILGVLILIVLTACNNKIKISEKNNIKNKEINYSCKTDSDCNEYVSANNCDVVCANKDAKNQQIINGFEKTCDSSLWDAPRMGCGCTGGLCKIKKSEVKKDEVKGNIKKAEIFDDFGLNFSASAGLFSDKIVVNKDYVSYRAIRQGVAKEEKNIDRKLSDQELYDLQIFIQKENFIDILSPKVDIGLVAMDEGRYIMDLSFNDKQNLVTCWDHQIKNTSQCQIIIRLRDKLNSILNINIL